MAKAVAAKPNWEADEAEQLIVAEVVPRLTVEAAVPLIVVPPVQTVT